MSICKHHLCNKLVYPGSKACGRFHLNVLNNKCGKGCGNTPVKDKDMCETCFLASKQQQMCKRCGEYPVDPNLNGYCGGACINYYND